MPFPPLEEQHFVREKCGGRNQEFCFIHTEHKILNVHVEKAGGSCMCNSEMPVSGLLRDKDLGII